MTDKGGQRHFFFVGLEGTCHRLHSGSFLGKCLTMSTACTLLSSLFLSWIKATRSLEDKTVCTWKMYLTYCPRHGCKWGCIQFGSPGSPLSPIAIPVSPHLLRILMWAVLTRSIVFQKHCPHGFLALGMEKSGGKKKGDSLGFQGQQRRLETSAVCLGTARPGGCLGSMHLWSRHCLWIKFLSVTTRLFHWWECFFYKCI